MLEMLELQSRGEKMKIPEKRFFGCCVRGPGDCWVNAEREAGYIG